MIEYFSYGIIALAFFMWAHIDYYGTIYVDEDEPFISSLITYFLVYILWLPCLFAGLSYAIYLAGKK